MTPELDPAALPPCPFCSGEPQLIDGGAGNCYVRCIQCNATGDDGSQAFALERWNRRASSAAPVQGGGLSPEGMEAAREKGRQLAGNQPRALVEAFAEIAAAGAVAYLDAAAALLPAGDAKAGAVEVETNFPAEVGQQPAGYEWKQRWLEAEERLAVVERENRDMHEALESGQAFGFDPATGYLHADDGGAPGSCIFYVPKEEAASASARIAVLEKALRRLMTDYVGLLEKGRDRIIDLGGTCDPVDVMEAGDPALRSARVALSSKDQAHE